MTLVFQYFGVVGKRQTNIYFFRSHYVTFSSSVVFFHYFQGEIDFLDLSFASVEDVVMNVMNASGPSLFNEMRDLIFDAMYFSSLDLPVDVAPSMDKKRLRQEFRDTWLWVDNFTE